MSEKTRYALVGVGVRSLMYTEALTGSQKHLAELVGLCDSNPGRLEDRLKRLRDDGFGDVPTYPAEDFDRMIAETGAERVIVTTGPDATHSDYILRAMELGCDVITEKPMTTDEDRCRAILETIHRTGRNVQVTFNYRYSPMRSQVKELLMDGAVGEVRSIDFAWPLNTGHGADYFRRWHRRRENSGSLLVHKATHHFDLVNWWLNDRPVEVFCHGSLDYYTPATAEKLGLTKRTERCKTCPHAGECKFYVDLAGEKNLRRLYLENEHHDGYFRDRCVFSEDIDIWDTMSVSVRYSRGAVLNYLLHAYSPWEGYQIAFNGKRGRLEHGTVFSTYISGEDSADPPGQIERKGVHTTLHPHFEDPRGIEVRTGQGGHGGGDPPLLRDLFDPDAPHDPLGRKADHVDGTYSILTGVAAARSIDTGLPVRIDDLVPTELLRPEPTPA
jgi:predicted dehydrogenase